MCSQGSPRVWTADQFCWLLSLPLSATLDRACSKYAGILDFSNQTIIWRYDHFCENMSKPVWPIRIPSDSPVLEPRQTLKSQRADTVKIA